MSKKYRLYQVDSFTNELFKGNPAGVIPNADGLTDEQMQMISRELNNSETAFIFSPTDNSHDVWVRFFTPKIEVPSCGHATIAAHYVRAIENNMETTKVIQKIGAGILPVEIIKNDKDYNITMTQGKIEFSEPLNSDLVNALLNSLGIDNTSLYDNCPVQIVSTGHSKVLIGLKSLQTLNSLKPEMSSLSKQSKELNCNGYFTFTFDTNDSNILTKGRMFAPSIGIDEDPVTGNANGPLGAYLIKHKLVNHNGSEFKFKGVQGETLNRTGEIDVTVLIEDDLPKTVKIGGIARIVFKTEIEL